MDQAARERRAPGDAAAGGREPPAPGPCATFSIQPPEPFNFSKPQEWERWIRRFERFRQASNLHTSSQDNQINTLMYCMGDEADDILKGLNLTAENMQSYDAVKEGFHAFFVVKKNVIYERARFNMRKQGENEPVDTFVTALYSLAEHCKYGPLHDELIRDRLVVGLNDIRLSERMQLDKDLTLEKAIDMARQSEAVKQQQSNLRGECVTSKASGSVDRVINKNKTFQSRQKVKSYHGANEKYKQSQSRCHKCGKSPSHPKTHCPANSVFCHACGKKGHYQKVCASSRKVNEIQEKDDDIFLGTVMAEGDPWLVDIIIKDCEIQFKIDTGADVTVMPDHIFHRIFKDGKKPALLKVTKPLLGPGCAPLSVVGVSNIRLQKGEKHTLEEVYVVKSLHSPLLGRPAITKLGLVTRVDGLSMDTLHNNYPKLCSGLGMLQRPYTIKLSPGAVPFSLKTPRRIPLPLMPKVKNELQRMEKMGVISRVEEPTQWCAGIVVVPKKSGDPRICVDLTKLNESVQREKFILPSVEQTLGLLAGARLFSKLDANMGFWQIPLAEESAKLTTFITPFGRYFFNRLPFGIASAPEHFQNRMVTEVTEGLDGVVCHMDDILVWGRSQEEHDTRLHAVLQKMEQAGITLNVDKCSLSQKKVKFLGHIISDFGVQPDPAKTAAVQEMPEPTTVTELRSFLGMVNQLGKFIPHLAEKDKPLRDLLSKRNCWVWGEAQATAFRELKENLTSTPVLALYDANKPIKVSADASSYGLGAVLLQQENNDWRPVAYASRSLTPVEQRYAQVEKEALGLTWACERFRDFLIGQYFEMETDHKPLLSLLGAQELDILPPRIQRFRMRLMRYSYKISHVPGKSLWTADVLSRAPLPASKDNTNEELMESTNIYVDNIVEHLPASQSFLDNLREHLKTDSVCSNVMRMCQDGWPESSRCTGPEKLYWSERAYLSVHDGLLLKGTRLVIPSVMRNDVLARLHEGHQGVAKCRERARQSVWWPGLSQQLNELVLKCHACIKERINHTEPLIPTNLPERPWQKLGTDLFVLKGKTYLLVVDYYSRYVEVANLSLTSSADITTHLKSIFARHGIPETLISDNGPQFSSSTFSDFATSYGFKHVTSSPKHPRSNGEAERAVQTVKNLLKKAQDPYLALLSYRSTPLQNGYSPAQMLMGRRLRTTVPILPKLLDPETPDSVTISGREREKRCTDMRHFNKRHRVHDLSNLSPGEQVWVTDQKVSGTVVEKHHTPRSYQVDVPHATIRRNRHLLIPMDVKKGDCDTLIDSQVTENNAVPQTALTPNTSPVCSKGSVMKTRSGRPVIKPKRLNL